MTNQIDISDFIKAIEIELDGDISAKEATAAWTKLNALTRKAHGIMSQAQANDPAYD